LRLIEVEKLDPGDAARILVAPGCEGDKPGECPESARDYYTKVIDQKLVGLNSLASTLDSFVSYFGYHGIRAVDLEILDSDVLMPHDQTSFDALRARVSSPTDFAANPNLTLATFKSGSLLSARFFAPKIVDYNAAPAAPGSGQDPHVAGWRKLIRLLALPNSDAYKKGGATAAYILFNFFEPNPGINPFPVKVSGTPCHHKADRRTDPANPVNQSIGGCHRVNHVRRFTGQVRQLRPCVMESCR
jgi:hypothetical protein